MDVFQQNLTMGLNYSPSSALSFCSLKCGVSSKNLTSHFHFFPSKMFRAQVNEHLNISFCSVLLEKQLIQQIITQYLPPVMTTMGTC